MHCSHLHSVDILLVCMRVCVYLHLHGWLPFSLLFSVVVHVCVPASTYTVRERDLLLSPMKNAFCHCSLIISSHVPVNENMKYLSWLSDSNCSISPAAIWVLNNLFRNCMKVGPATMLFASCSTGSL